MAQLSGASRKGDHIIFTMHISCITRQKFPNFSKTFENQKFPKWLTNFQKNKHQILIKNLILSHNHPCQKHEGKSKSKLQLVSNLKHVMKSIMKRKTYFCKTNDADRVKNLEPFGPSIICSTN